MVNVNIEIEHTFFIWGVPHASTHGVDGIAVGFGPGDDSSPLRSTMMGRAGATHSATWHAHRQAAACGDVFQLIIARECIAPTNH